MQRFARTTLFATAVSLATLALAGEALAQPRTADQAKPGEPRVEGSGASYQVEFDDDALNALESRLIIPRIHVVKKAARTLLLRPRTSFVTELWKSVEAL